MRRPVEEEEVIAWICHREDEGWSISRIASWYGRSDETVRKRLVKEGVIQDRAGGPAQFWQGDDLKLMMNIGGRMAPPGADEYDGVLRFLDRRLEEAFVAGEPPYYEPHSFDEHEDVFTRRPAWYEAWMQDSFLPKARGQVARAA